MPSNLTISPADLQAAERELCSRSLAAFVRRAWHVLEPGQPYIHGWHVDAICEHLQAITEGQINRLLINIPPGTMKSTLVSVFWPAWEWGPKGRPYTRIIGASHEQGLAVRDTRKMRNLITSDWYQALWPLALTSDQNQKTFYENESTGFRQACAVASMTGRRGDRVLWDDPHSVEAALSDAHRETANRVFQETLPTRLNNPDSSAIVIVMQRLHEADVSGLIIENDYGYEHLCLPMEFEPERRCSTSIGFTDPRTEDGELLFPGRFSRETVDRDKKVMGAMAVAGQFQQRPAPRGGGFFAWQQVQIVDSAPKLTKVVRFWDKAGTDGAGAYTAGVKMGVGEDGLFYVLDVVRGQWSAAPRERTIRATAELDGVGVKQWIEQEPGSGGKESAEATIRNLAGYSIEAERPTGDKAVRAEPFSVQVEAGNVRMVRGEWNQAYIDEMKTFPVGKYKDQMDASGGAFNKIATNNYRQRFAAMAS
ncbi:phage terminase large subunit [Halomonas pacifica]|uniref:phage terminase large subunit n=1 Tax=Bisbaumannia pacifica TaxID=77098 RepID=UPI0023588125|nr:phage terminase large subunit [Halomonas pacifica]MDC8803929.1 phage terminase large subunit [Halomonas pacifica]